MTSPSKTHEDISSAVNVINKSPPSEAPSPDDTDAIIAREMTNLSMVDREQVFFDVHGVSNEVLETPQLIADSLKALDQELDLIDDKVAYDLAEQQNPDYVRNSEFQLMFLRADRFDAKNTALRLARHFDTKLELFGADKLVRDIVQDDLDEDDIEALYSGTAQFLPIRDRAGRTVVFHFANTRNLELKSLSKYRRVFYLFMSIARDIETQKKGVVALGFTTLPALSKPPEDAFKEPQIMKAMPLRIEAMHLCYKHIGMLPIIALVKIAASIFIRLRIRMHYGNPRDCLKSLLAYGIPTEVMPLTKDGEIEREAFGAKLVKLRTEERLAMTVNTICVPSKLDVLLGRGRRIDQHVGNIRYRMLVEDCKDKYDKASKLEKTQITVEIVQIVKEAGGRFLKEDDNIGWVQVDYVVAREKVSHTFRGLRKSKTKNKELKQQQQQQQQQQKGTKLERPTEIDDTQPSKKRTCA